MYVAGMCLSTHIFVIAMLFFQTFVIYVNLYTSFSNFSPFQSMQNTGNMYVDIYCDLCHFYSKVPFHGKLKARIMKDKQDNE